MPDQARQDYCLQQQVVGTIEKVMRYGIFINLDDGTRAYVRRRELTWAGTIDPRTLWKEGDRIEGIVIKLDDSEYSLELSHRAILSDPWQEFAKQFQQGDIIEGIVKSVLAYGIFVEIMPGVDGLIPIQELATWDIKKPEDVIWIGDQIEAVITRLNSHARKLRLSVRARLQQQDLVTGVVQKLNPLSNLNIAYKPDVSKIVYLEEACQTIPPFFERVGRILVVDDYDDIRLPLVDWLQHQGYAVDAAKNTKEAIEKIFSERYGLLIVDLNLSDSRDGLALLQQIRQGGSNCHAVIMTTPEHLAKRSCEIEEVGVVEVFVKPLDLDEILQLLTRIGRGEVMPPWQMTTVFPQLSPSKPFHKLAPTVNTNHSLVEQFRFGLKQLIIASGAEHGLIFKFNPISQAISITIDIGEIELNRAAIHALKASPVREVIRDSEQILENRVSDQAQARFRKLLDLLSFESCIGVPIEAAGETHRAVFLFHRQPETFNHHHLRDTLTTCSLFSVAIERGKIEHRFQSMDKILLSGQLAGGFSHEVYNKLSGLELQLRNLQLDCQVSDPETIYSLSLGEMQQTVGKILTTFSDLKETVELFQQLMRSEDEQHIDINEIIRRAVSLLRPTMQSQRVSIETQLSDKLPNLIGNSIQLQQLFFNIMLNAAQQMALKPKRGKILTVKTSYQDQDKMHPIKIRITDMGPGIHRRLHEKIFQLGFTTRTNGTGQGLYIARSLVDSLGGKICVEKSYMLIGTTFLVELPTGKYH